MKFYKAFKKICKSPQRTMRRREWTTPTGVAVRVVCGDPYLWLRTGETWTASVAWRLSYVDLFANDWEVEEVRP